MRILLKRLFFALKYFAYLLLGIKNSKNFHFSKWIVDDGDNKHLINHPLDKNSLVVEVGGYKGDFSNKMVSLYNPKLIILEPVSKYYSILVKQYKIKPNVKIFQYGLSNKSGTKNIFLSEDGSSLYKRKGKKEKIQLVDASKFINKYKYINLFSINIEGTEYEVLEKLISSKSVQKIDRLQIQFHDFVPNAKKRRGAIVKQLLKSHRILYSYPFVWEGFELKKN